MIFSKGLQAVEPSTAVKRYCKLEDELFSVGNRHYDLSRFKNLFVIGAGKASAPMAQALEDLLGKRITKGLINVKYDHTIQLNRIKMIEAGHPIPDEKGWK